MPGSGTAPESDGDMNSHDGVGDVGIDSPCLLSTAEWVQRDTPFAGLATALRRAGSPESDRVPSIDKTRSSGEGWSGTARTISGASPAPTWVRESPTPRAASSTGALAEPSRPSSDRMVVVL